MLHESHGTAVALLKLGKIPCFPSNWLRSRLIDRQLVVQENDRFNSVVPSLRALSGSKNRIISDK